MLKMVTGHEGIKKMYSGCDGGWPKKANRKEKYLDKMSAVILQHEL